jgi:hypothetical protein
MRKLILVITLAVMVAFGSEALAQGLSLDVVPVTGKRVFDTNQKQFVWSYSAKFLCGTISPLATAPQLGNPLVPGVYLTAINIRNYNFKSFVILKKAVETKSEFEQPGKIGSLFPVDLVAGGGLEVDCNDIIFLLCGPLNPNAPPCVDLTTQFIKGFVAIESPLDLDVVGVYTAKPTP